MRHAPLKQRKLPPYGSWQRLFAADVCGQVGQKRRRRAARGEDQLVLCARHAHIKEPALLFRIRRAERRRIAVQKGASLRLLPVQKTHGRKGPHSPAKNAGLLCHLPPTKCARAQGMLFPVQNAQGAARNIRAAPALFSRKGTFPSPISDLKSLCGTRRRNDRQGAPCLRRGWCSRAAGAR